MTSWHELHSYYVEPDDDDSDYCPECGYSWDRHEYGKEYFDHDGYLIDVETICPLFLKPTCEWPACIKDKLPGDIFCTEHREFVNTTTFTVPSLDGDE